jgi:phage tail sheath protein FI
MLGVDDRRVVHKAPANEPILGAVGLRQEISRVKQEPLNDVGVNCIRNLNGNIRVWGARTLGAGKVTRTFKYINIRRQFLYLRESIDEGTQWVVFEPNSPELWARIRRNVGAFLTNEWRKGPCWARLPRRPSL